MSKTIIFHNPRCSKSRQTLQLLEDNGIKPEIRLYLDSPPNESEIRDISKKLGLDFIDFTRKNDPIYKESNVEPKDLPKLLESNPILIERPIVIHNNKAAIGRPPEQVLELFK